MGAQQLDGQVLIVVLTPSIYDVQQSRQGPVNSGPFAFSESSNLMFGLIATEDAFFVIRLS